MSVINTMLKDLERRGADDQVAGDKILGGLSAGGNNFQDKGSSSKAYLLSLTGVIAVIAAIIGGYYISPYKLVDAADGKALPVMAQTGHVAPANDRAQPQQTKSELIASNASDVARAETTQDKVISGNTPSAQLREPASTLQKVSSSTATQAEAAPAAKAAGVVERSAPVAPVHEKIIAQSTVKNAAADSERAQPVAEDDTAETTEESMHVVTKQQREFTPAEKSQQAYAAAVTMYDQGRKQEAKSSLTLSLALNPGNADACRLLTVLYLEDGRADLAGDTVEAGLKQHGADQNLLRLYVQTLVKQEKYSEAIAVMGRQIRLSTPEDLGYMAGLYQKNNDHLEAVKYYTEALQLVPHKSVWWLGQGISLEILQQYKEAIESYQKSVSTGELSTKLMEYAISRVNTIKHHHPELKS